jgi:Domain of unknown function (DUF4190)
VSGNDLAVSEAAVAPPPALDGRAIAALIFGIGCWIAIMPVVPAAIGIWCGVTARRRIAAEPGRRGRGLALAGTILAILNLVAWAALIAVLIADAV